MSYEDSKDIAYSICRGDINNEDENKEEDRNILLNKSKIFPDKITIPSFILEATLLIEIIISYDIIIGSMKWRPLWRIKF